MVLGEAPWKVEFSWLLWRLGEWGGCQAEGSLETENVICEKTEKFKLSVMRDETEMGGLVSRREIIGRGDAPECDKAREMMCMTRLEGMQKEGPKCLLLGPAGIPDPWTCGFFKVPSV